MSDEQAIEARTERLRAELAKMTERAERAEANYAAAAAENARGLEAFIAMTARAEQTERERDEARHAVLARFNEATEERAARELAVADNAVLLQHINNAGHAMGMGHFDVANDILCRASAGPHPGAALLEYVRASEKVREALGSRARSVTLQRLVYEGREKASIHAACAAADVLKVKP